MAEEQQDLTKNAENTEKVKKTDEQWKNELTKQEYEVLRKSKTEAAFSGEYDKYFPKKGYFVCKGCGNVKCCVFLFALLFFFCLLFFSMFFADFCWCVCFVTKQAFILV